MKLILVIVIFVSLLAGTQADYEDRLLCQASRILFEYVKTHMPEQPTPEVIKGFVYETCTQNPLISQFCDTYVFPNLDKIVRFIQKGTSLKEISRELGLRCGRNKRMAESKKMEWAEIETLSESVVAMEPLVVAEEEEFKPCEVCLFITTFLQNEIEGGRTDENIAYYLDNTCNQFDLGVNDCKRIISENYDVLVSLLKGEITPAAMCSLELGMCTEEWWNSDVSVQGFSCELCEFVIDYAYRKIGSDNNMDKIDSVLKNVCDKIPLVKGLCKEFVSRYLPRLKEYLLNRFSPNVVCTKLKVCRAYYYEHIMDLASVVFVKEFVETHPFEVVADASSTECQVCQWIISAIESWLSDGHNQTEIALFLNQVCNFFGQYAPQCEHMVRAYTPKVIESIIEKQTPPAVCASIGTCKL